MNRWLFAQGYRGCTGGCLHKTIGDVPAVVRTRLSGMFRRLFAQGYRGCAGGYLHKTIGDALVNVCKSSQTTQQRMFSESGGMTDGRMLPANAFSGMVLVVVSSGFSYLSENR